MSLFRCGGGSSQKVAIGTATISTSTTTYVDLGFKPKQLFVRMTNASEAFYVTTVYDENVFTNQQQACTTSGGSWIALPSTNGNRLASIDNTGFTYNKSNDSRYLIIDYYAIG